MAKRILIFGNNAQALAMISAQLTAASYSFTIQTDATYAPEHAQGTNAILIVIDRNPGDDTIIWQTVQRLRLDRILTHLPLIICTNLEPRMEETHFYRERHILFVLKPFEDGSLLTAINSTLTDSQRQPAVSKYMNGHQG